VFPLALTFFLLPHPLRHRRPLALRHTIKIKHPHVPHLDLDPLLFTILDDVSLRLFALFPTNLHYPVLELRLVMPDDSAPIATRLYLLHLSVVKLDEIDRRDAALGRGIVGVWARQITHDKNSVEGGDLRGYVKVGWREHHLGIAVDLDVEFGAALLGP
jgi:hypothetical protein